MVVSTLLALLLVAWADADALPRLLGIEVADDNARRVVERPTLIQALPAVRYSGTPRMTEWLLAHPPLAATLARHLHPPLERYQVRGTATDAYEVNDQAALRGTLRRLASAPQRAIFLCAGEFRSLAHLVALSGSMVFTLHYQPVRDERPTPQMEVQPTLYLRLDNVLAHGVMKVLGPLLHGVIDRRFSGLAQATAVVADRITREPRALYGEMRGWSDVSAADLEAFRAEFLQEGIR